MFNLKLNIVVILLLLSATTYGDTLIEQLEKGDKNVESMILESTGIVGVNLGEGVNKIFINITCPQNSENQKFDLESKDVNLVKDDNGNYICNVIVDNPPDYLEKIVKGKIYINATHTYDLKSSYDMPQEYVKYTQPTKNIQSNSSLFKELATKITDNSKDDFERIAKLAIWVNNYMTYDLSYQDKNYDAIYAYKQKKGVCSEYTTLYLALARSIGIPSRYISAYAYGDYGWERHGYAESYIGGKWVPVDPLWLQVGYLDATHIKYGYYTDNQVSHNIVARGTSLRDISWRKDEYNFEIKNITFDEGMDYELNLSLEKYHKGDTGVVYLKIKSDEYMVPEIILSECSGSPKVVFIDEPEKEIILKSGEEKIIKWKFKINEELDDNKIYTCPLTLNSRSLATKTIDVVVDTSKGIKYATDGNRTFLERIESWLDRIIRWLKSLI